MAENNTVNVPVNRLVEEEPDTRQAWYKQPLPLWKQMILFIPVLLFTVLVLGTAIVITNARMPDPSKVAPLPDFLLEWIPLARSLEAGTDIVIFLFNATTVIVALKIYLLERSVHGLPNFTLLERVPKVGVFLNRIVFGIIDSGRRPYPLRGVSKIMAIRFLTSYAIVMIFRAFVITATSYPATDNHCQHPQVIEHPVLNVILTLVTLGGGAIHCGDLMFSGHTMILCVTFLLIWDYSPYLHPWAFRVCGCVLLPTSFYFILASRSHYTDDILVAAYCMIATYKLLDHCETGAPWQLQLLIRWVPLLGSNKWVDEWPADSADGVIIVETLSEVESPIGKGLLNYSRDTSAEEHGAANPRPSPAVPAATSGAETRKGY